MERDRSHFTTRHGLVSLRDIAPGPTDRDALRAALLAFVILLLVLVSALGGSGCAREAQSRPSDPGATNPKPALVETTSPATAPAPTPRPELPPSPASPSSSSDGAPAAAPAASDAAAGSGVETVSLVGTATPVRAVTLAAEAGGRVDAVRVDVGDRVEEGATLVRVDYAMQRAQVRQARANHTLARRTRDRLEKLLSTDAISRQAVDEARARAQQTWALLKMARVGLDRATVRSTLAGVVTRRHVEPGEYVNPGQPVLDVVDLSQVLVHVPVPETLAPKVPLGATVPVRFDALDETRDGTVRVLVPTADDASGTYELRVAVVNADGRILGGMAATVTLRCGEDDARRVAAAPTTAVAGATDEPAPQETF